MEQKCSNKIISLHLQKCNNPCSNKKVCYHLNKDIYGCNISDKIYKWIIETAIPYGYTIHDSVCGEPSNFHKHLLNFSNYNITINSDHINELDIEKYKKQLQLTVTSIDDICKYKNFQKLYLIKDNYTYSEAKSLMNCVETGKLHFVFNQSFINKEILSDITKSFMKRYDIDQSLDSCYSSWLLNGKCPYKTNYIDLTFDGTLRKCPFEKEGLLIKSIDNLFNINLERERNRCIYEKIFG